MRKISTLLFALFLLLLSNICSADVVITGITSPSDMNGVYTEMGTWAGRPYFERVVGMETYSVFYHSIMDPSAGWMIYRGAGQYAGGMWSPGNGHWLISGTEMFPPVSGWVSQPVMTMFPVAGTPAVNEAPAIPLSLWGVVAAFVLVGGILIYRFNRKKVKIA